MHVYGAPRRFDRFLCGQLFGPLFRARRGGQEAEHLACPPAGGPCQVVARVLAPSHVYVKAVPSGCVFHRAHGRSVDRLDEVGDVLLTLRPALGHVADHRRDDSADDLVRLAVKELFDPARRVLRAVKGGVRD